MTITDVQVKVYQGNFQCAKQGLSESLNVFSRIVPPLLVCSVMEWRTSGIMDIQTFINHSIVLKSVINVKTLLILVRNSLGYKMKCNTVAGGDKLFNPG